MKSTNRLRVSSTGRENGRYNVATETTNLHTENNYIRKFTGVDRFHNAGYFGERVTAATGENWSIKNYNPDDLVLIPFGDGYGWGNFSGGHGSKTAATFFQVAPKARLVQLSKISRARTGKDCYCGLEDDCLPYIEEYGITSVFCSFDMICDKYLAQKYQTVIDGLGTFNMFVAAGNEYSTDYVELARCDAVTTVGAYYIQNNKAIPEDFSSTTEYLDFSAPDSQVVKFAKETGVTTYGKQTGTSFAAPWLCGMACLVNDFFIDKTGKPLTHEAMMRFFRDHCVDIGAEGFDSKTGHGMVILPEPSEINVWKYQTKEGGETMYKDENQISEWAKENVKYCNEYGIMEGDADGKFRPQDFVTREELACTLARIHKSIQ